MEHDRMVIQRARHLGRRATLGWVALLPALLLCGAGGALAYPLKRIPLKAVTSLDPGGTCQGRGDDGKPAFKPRHLMDGLRWTSWCSDAGRKAAVGTKIRIEFATVHYVARLGIINGDIRSPKHFKRSIQTRTIALRYEGGERSYDLARNVVEPQELTLPAPVATKWLELEVRQIYPKGTRGPCFSEIVVEEPKDVLSLKPGMQERIVALVAKLGDPDARDEAMAALEAVGPPATPWIVGALRSGDVDEKIAVVKLLASMGDPSVAEPLIDAYEKSRDPRLHRAILEAMAVLKPVAAIPFLVERTRDPSTARLALLAMEGFGDERTLQPFLKAVIHGDEPLARIAIRHLAGFGYKAYKALIPYLTHPSVKVRERATWALGRIDHPAARKTLMRLLRTGTQRIALAAIRGLGETGSDEAFEIITLNVDSDDPQVREAVADALGGFSGNEQAAEHLVSLATDPVPEVRRRAMDSLVRLGPVAIGSILDVVRKAEGQVLADALAMCARLPQPQAGRVQIALLDDPRKEVRQAALAQIELRGQEGLSELIRAMVHQSPRVRFVASRRIAQMGESALPILTKDAVHSEDPKIRMACFKAIAQIGSRAAREAILAGLEDPDPGVRKEALHAAMRVPWEAYGPLLPKLLDTQDMGVHRMVVEVAGASRAREAVPKLVEQLEAGHPNAIRILWALGKIGDPRALPALAEMAKSKAAFTRQQAVMALGGIHDERALSLLMEAMLDPDPMVRRAAERALGRP